MASQGRHAGNCPGPIGVGLASTLAATTMVPAADQAIRPSEDQAGNR